MFLFDQFLPKIIKMKIYPKRWKHVSCSPTSIWQCAQNEPHFTVCILTGFLSLLFSLPTSSIRPLNDSVLYVTAAGSLSPKTSTMPVVRYGRVSIPVSGFQFFCRKLHENGRIWTRETGSLAPPLDPPMNLGIIGNLIHYVNVTN